MHIKPVQAKSTQGLFVCLFYALFNSISVI